MKSRTGCLLFLAPVVIFAVTLLFQIYRPPGGDAPAPAGPAEVPTGPQPAEAQPTPVTLNRGSEVRDGFRGDVHPVLFSLTRLNVTAQWTPVGKGRDHIDRDLHPDLYAYFTNLEPAQPQHTYTEYDFSGFLPQTVGDVGQVWALDGDRVLRFLGQFHPRPSLNLVAAGRRAGPDGAFGILRAVSPSYLDIAFRIHAEFSLIPPSASSARAHFRAWYTPAYFSGRLLVNQRSGTVDYFRLGLATDRALNVHLTLIARGLDPRWTQAHDVVRVEQMELMGGDDGPAQNTTWTAALNPAEAQRRLAKVFYKFHDIDWVPFDQVAARARTRDRPIMAIVSWGSFDDQSC